MKEDSDIIGFIEKMLESQIGLLPEACQHEIREAYKDSRKRMAKLIVIGTSAGDLVKLHLNEGGKIIKADIEPCVFDSSSTDLLSSLIVVAYEDGVRRLRAEVKNIMDFMEERVMKSVATMDIAELVGTVEDKDLN